ncbi:MAG: PEP-CTERM sorting domain-containing protein [Phycisphaerales bacterium JB060]
MKTPNKFLMLTAGVALSATQAAMAQYDAGDTWHRASDWAPGVVPGGSTNNPGPGFDGVGVWQYENANGGDGLGGTNPWYTQETTMLSWDSNWWGHGIGVWSQGNDINAPISQGKMSHNLVGSIHNDAPIVRWMMPEGTPELNIDVNGQFDVLWTGHEYRGTDMDVELVIARETAGGSFDVLFSDVLSKPTPGVSIGDTASSMVNLSGISMADGDSLIISGRGVSSVGTGDEGRWIDITDDLNVSVSAVPAPASLALLGLGGLAAARRRR